VFLSLINRHLFETCRVSRPIAWSTVWL